MIGQQTRPEYQQVTRRMPDDDVSRLRDSIEGVGRGTGDYVQQAEKFERLASRARTEGLVLYGYSDGAMSEDRRIGAYGWLVAVKSAEGALVILAGGGLSAAHARGGCRGLAREARPWACGEAGGKERVES